MSPLASVLGKELPDAGRTATGAQWVRWGGAGWYAVGSRAPAFGKRPSFWRSVLLLAMESGGNQRMDTVHAIGPDLLSVGALGLTAASGHAQTLIGLCLRHAPDTAIHYLAPIIAQARVYPAKYDSRYVLRSADQRIVLEERSELTLVLRAGGDGHEWAPEAKRISKMWVENLSQMLRDEVFDAAQVEFCTEYMPPLLTDESQRLIQWPRSAARDAWQYTEEAQALWATALVLALEDSDATNRLVQLTSIGSYRSPAWVSARKRLASMYYAAVSSDSYPTLRERTLKIFARLPELFGVSEPTEVME